MREVISIFPFLRKPLEKFCPKLIVLGEESVLYQKIVNKESRKRGIRFYE